MAGSLFYKLLHIFSEDKQDFLNQFRAAQKDSDPTAATRAAHSLKGVAANLGANNLSSLAAALEITCKNKSDDIEPRLSEVVAELNKVLAGIAALKSSTVEQQVDNK